MAQPATKAKQKRKFVLPNTFVLIFGFIVLAAILTYVLPAGSYQPDPNNPDLIDPNSFTFVESSPVSLMDFAGSIYGGLARASSTAFLILLAGGFVQVITDTGTFDAAIFAILRRSKGKELIAPVLFFILLFVLGALQVIDNEVVVFIPLVMMLCKRLKLDAICVLMLTLVANMAGFSPTPVGYWSVGIFQIIAGLPIFSGFTLRFVVCMLIGIVTLVFMVRYMRKIRRDPAASVTGILKEDVAIDGVPEEKEFTLRHGIILVGFLVPFGFYVWAVNAFDWGVAELSGILFLQAIFAGLISRMSPNEMAQSFTRGAEAVVIPTMMVGFASAISVVLAKGNIIHTIVYYLTKPLMGVHGTVSAVGMFIFNFFFNALAPASTSQGYVVMPIMAPMGDVLGLTRQTVCWAVQLGDGLSNIIIPTGGTTMACIAMSGVPYGKWVKFIIPLVGIWVLIGAASLVFAVLTGWA